MVRILGFAGITAFLITLNGLIVAAHISGFQYGNLIYAGYAVIQGLAAFACFYVSKKLIINRKMWFSAGFAMTSWFIKSGILALYAITGNPYRELPGMISAILMIGYLPLIICLLSNIGHLKLPFNPEKKRLLAGISMIDLAGFLLVLEFVLIPYWVYGKYLNVFSQILASAPIILDWLILTALLLASHKLLERQIDGWFIFAVPAAVFNIASDIPLYFYGFTMNPVTINLGSLTASFIAFAAIDATTSALIGTIRRTPQKEYRASKNIWVARIPWNTFILPFAVTSCIPLVWTSQAIHHYNTGHFALGAISTFIIFLSIYRSHLFAVENRALSHNARIDSLTGLNNHRHFHESLTKAIISSDITRQAVSLVIIDVDDFANINSLHGHLFGDKVLATIGVCIRSQIRNVDEGCRVGGDEFAVIMPDTDPETALILATQLKSNLQETVARMTTGIDLTFSIGISGYPEIATTKDDLFDTADGALYWSKFHGKNSILIYDPRIVESLSADERAKKAEDQLFLEMVNSLAEVVDARDSYTMCHSKNVSRLSGILANAAGFSKEAVCKIEAAGLLHDIGKIGVPDHILNKPGKLSDDEMMVIKNHPVTSGHIIESTSLKDIAGIIRAHHERWDGKGYPDGLKELDIPIEARILAIADTFDAMTTDRPYRKGCSIEEALAEISKCSGTQFDPSFAKIFIEAVGISDIKHTA